MDNFDIGSLLQQFQPSEQDRRDARTQALFAASMAAFGGHGNGWRIASQMGQAGLGTYRAALQNVSEQRHNQLRDALAAYQLQGDAQKMQDAATLRQQQTAFAKRFATPGANQQQPPSPDGLPQTPNAQPDRPPGQGLLQSPDASSSNPTAGSGLLNSNALNGDRASLLSSGLALDEMSADGFGPPALLPQRPATQQPTQQPSSLPNAMRRVAPVTPPAGPTQSGIPDKRALANMYQQQGDWWMQNGQPQKAQAYYDLAQKTIPQIKDTKNLTDPTGKRVVVNFYTDGSHEILPDVGPDQEKAHFLDTGSVIGAVDPFTGQPIKGGGLYNRTVTPGEQLSANVTMRGQNMTNARALTAENGVPEQFTQDAIGNAASRYNIDGTLPPMGLGRSGANARAAILNRAAELNKGISGDEQRITQISNKANTAALTKLQTQQTMVSAFEKTFNSNADMVRNLSTRVDSTGIPIANKWINMGKRAITGDPNLSAYDAAIKGTVNEYAKIVSGSMGNTAMAESEIKKANDLLNAAQTPAQVNAVLDMMRRETANRMAGFNSEKSALRTGMGSTTAPAQPSGWSVRRVN